jgi:hypothetical protein
MNFCVWKPLNGDFKILVSHLFEVSECKQWKHDKVHYLSQQ